MKTKIALILTAAALILGMTAVRAEDKPRIGYVDAQKILSESKAGKHNEEILKRLFNEKKVILDRELAKLKADNARLVEDLKKNELIYSAKQKSDLVSQFRAKEQRLMQMQREAEKEFETKRRELFRTAVQSIRAVVAEVAKEQKLMLVYDVNSQPLYAEAGPDLTDKVMALYNKKHPN